LAREGTQAARVAARETAEGSPQGETSGSERVNIPERSGEAGPSWWRLELGRSRLVCGVGILRVVGVGDSGSVLGC
jgi:hypothetical protein